MPEIDSVRQGTALVIARHKREFYGAWAAALVLIFAGFIYIMSRGTGYAASTWMFLLVPLAVPLFFYFRFARQARQMMVAQIAQSLGYAYAANAPLQSISGVLFSRGWGRKIANVLSGSYRDKPVRLFSYQYTVQQGKASYTYINTVCELTFSEPVPHIVLLPHSFMDMTTGTDVGAFSGLDAMERAELEGGFNEHFDVYIERGAQLELREIFQPDVMQYLIDRFAGCDLEIGGTKLYVLVHGQYATRDEYVALHELADTLIDALLPGLRSASAGGGTASAENGTLAQGAAAI